MKNNWQTKKFGEISDDEIRTKIRISLGLLYKNDSFLLTNAAHERTVVHKLAEYLQQQFLDWDVDCEYNRDGDITKILPRECQGVHKENVYPDIIVHHRGLRGTGNNLLVFELKLNKSDVVNECDEIKLREFTKIKGDYQYRLGVFIGFDELNDPQIEFYSDGKQIKP